MKKLPIIFRFPWIICASVVLRFLCLFVFVFHCTRPYWWLTPRKYNKKKEKSRERIDENTSETKSFWVSGCVTPFRKRQKMWDNTHTHNSRCARLTENLSSDFPRKHRLKALRRFIATRLNGHGHVSIVSQDVMIPHHCTWPSMSYLLGQSLRSEILLLV